MLKVLQIFFLPIFLVLGLNVACADTCEWKVDFNKVTATGWKLLFSKVPSSAWQSVEVEERVQCLVGPLDRGEPWVARLNTEMFWITCSPKGNSFSVGELASRTFQDLTGLSEDERRKWEELSQGMEQEKAKVEVTDPGTRVTVLDTQTHQPLYVIEARCKRTPITPSRDRTR